ncbi:MAG: CpsD/CapB family tyrosine-protein kinase [Clostridia bacterium]|nr:CpsD/CapB family tyrosine-protein kinase [Clostridia bacterium]
MDFNILSDYKTLDDNVLDSIKTLRTNIQFASISHEIKTLVMTSCIPNEGKSTISTFLALAMAEAGKKTLLVECDLRHTTLRKRMKIPRSNGMVNYLQGNVSLEEAISVTAYDNLYFLDAETRVPNPVELISSKPFTDMMDKLRDMFDIVVFDTPPIGTFIDAALFAAKSDATIVLVKPGVVEKRLFKKCIEQLEKANANIIGVILNGTDQVHSGYYGKYYNRKYYKYGKGKK